MCVRVRVLDAIIKNVFTNHQIFKNQSQTLKGGNIFLRHLSSSRMHATSTKLCLI